jgi:hypothetical protein
LQIAQRYLQRVITVTTATSVRIKELYISPNGDRWTLCRNSAGNLSVFHEPNAASGGNASENEITSFLSKGRHGPEHQALLQAFAELGMHAGQNDTSAPAEPPSATPDEMSRALGRAVARCWSDLPQDIQHALFEAAVKSEGEASRQHLAVFLHGKHARTQDALHTAATREPSLGA